MKITDLMIGDWVTFRDDPNIPIKIWGINEDGTAFAFIEKSKALDEIAIDDEIIGIPLTKEILINNGWLEESDYENDLYGGHFPEDKEHRLELDIDGSEIWWTINCAENYIIQLRYVHELQHALKLCGIDKEIIL